VLVDGRAILSNGLALKRELYRRTHAVMVAQDRESTTAGNGCLENVPPYLTASCACYYVHSYFPVPLYTLSSYYVVTP
jgi:hypothetical protein